MHAGSAKPDIAPDIASQTKQESWAKDFLALFVFRCVQALYAIITGDREMIIASHEAEELIENNRNIVAD